MLSADRDRQFYAKTPFGQGQVTVRLSQSNFCDSVTQFVDRYTPFLNRARRDTYEATGCWALVHLAIC